MVSETPEDILEAAESGLNPCSSGIWSRSDAPEIFYSIFKKVLILVLVEYGLGAGAGYGAFPRS